MFLATSPASPMSGNGGAVIAAIIGATIVIMLFKWHKIICIISLALAAVAANGYHAAFPAQPGTGIWIAGVIAFLLVYGLGVSMFGGK